MPGLVTVGDCVVALRDMVQFEFAQRECGRMWHAMRYARLNLIELKARRFVSQKDLAEAHSMLKSTRAKYLAALDRMFELHDKIRHLL